MKPIYFLIFLLLTLFACTDQQTELEGASHAMRFGVEEVEDTKGAVITTQNIRSMSVFCAHTGTGKYSSSSTCDWMHNVQVTRADENSEWAVQGEGNKQWAGDGYHSFFAFAPHAPEVAEVSLPEKQGPPTLTYTVPTDHTKQVDLLYSLTTPINCKQMYIGNRPVVFGFRHALAKITFDARKEAIVEDEVTITNIRLSSIINKARYEFKMTDGYTDVEGINRFTVSTDTTSFSITPNQVLTNDSTLLLPADQALFMINQSFTANNKLYVTYNKGTETGRTITADLSVVTPKGWDFSKAYRYSILVKEDKVTITAQITDWNDEEVNVSVPGTYLNIAKLSYLFTQGSAGDIYYSTDGSSVTATCNNGITLIHDSNNKKFTFPATAAVGNYTVTITAGKLKREVRVEVKLPPYIQIGNLLWATGNLVADGPNNCKIGQPQDGGLYFKFGSLIGWTGGATGDGTGQPSATPSLEVKVRSVGYTVLTTWDGHSAGNIEGSDYPTSGHGDPCRYYLKDGWRLPKPEERGQGDPLDGSITKPANCISGRYLAENNVNKNPRVWFENAGYRSTSSGTFVYSATDWTAYYWCNLSFGNNYWRISYTEWVRGQRQTDGNGYPVRCVKPAP